MAFLFCSLSFSCVFLLHVIVSQIVMIEYVIIVNSRKSIGISIYLTGYIYLEVRSFFFSFLHDSKIQAKEFVLVVSKNGGFGTRACKRF